ncbi:MAG: TauD/TfdA dioxygenase family protein, partial [Gammaproteobacteria bacterium]
VSVAGIFELRPLPGATFGALLHFACKQDARAAIAMAESEPHALPRALYEAGGLLVVPGLEGIAEEPALLVRLSRLFGAEVENYLETLTPANAVHRGVPEILLVSNMAPCNRQPPPLPDPPLTAGGKLPTQFPHRRGWHTDQSFRRPPPDISLFYAVLAAPKGQGQTLYADGTAAYAALPSELESRIEGLEGIHAMPGCGRSEQAVVAGETPQALEQNQLPQRQPVVRTHPVTGKRALYLCEAGQMDWVDGPFAGLQPGPDGDGARLLYDLMRHYTQPQFTYTHDWTRGDLIIYDNRSLIHAATWFDSSRHERLMWRTTVMGNPGATYAGEPRSWMPRETA